jgi:hypothetical protein
MAEALKHILKQLCGDDQCISIILLSSISMKILSVAQADVHYKQAANLKPGCDLDVILWCACLIMPMLLMLALYLLIQGLWTSPNCCSRVAVLQLCR